MRGSAAVGRGEAPDDRRDELSRVADRHHVFRRRPGDRDVSRCPLLQQEVGRLDEGLGVKARAHDPAVKDIVEGDERHALVVRHVRADNGHQRVLGKPGRRVVESFVEAVHAAAAGFREALEVPDRGPRIDHGRQRGRVRGDDDIVAQPPPETRGRARRSSNTGRSSRGRGRCSRTPRLPRARRRSAP